MAGSIAVPIGRITDDLVEGLCKVGRSMKVGATDAGGEVDMGPLITRTSRPRGRLSRRRPRRGGRHRVLDGRSFDLPGDGFLLGPSVVDRVKPTMRLAREEIFGPVLSVMRTDDWKKLSHSAGNASTATAPAFSPAAVGPHNSLSGTSTPA